MVARNEIDTAFPARIPGLGRYRWIIAEGRLTWDGDLPALYGLERPPEGERGFFERIHPDDRLRVEAEMAAVIAGEDSYVHEFRILRPDGDVRVVLDRGVVERAPDGTAIALSGVDVDITELRLGDEEPEPSAQDGQDAGRMRGAGRGEGGPLRTPRSRLLETSAILESLFEGAPVGLGVWDRDFRFLRLNGALAELNGLPVEAHIGRRPDEILPDIEGMDELFAGWRHVLETGEPWTGVDVAGATPADPAAQRRWREHFFPVRVAGRIIGLAGVVEEVTDQAKAQAQIELLMRELNHRSKNLLGLVQAVARQTARSNPEHFLERFQKRMEALARSQDLLVAQSWHNVRLGDLARSQLGHFGDLLGTRIRLEGPPRAEVDAQAAQALGMALHELGTNAGKHGALSGAEGRVTLSWEILPGNDRLRIVWQERGGPVVQPPRTRGFGTTVIDRMIRTMLDADVRLEFAPEGLSWAIEIGAGEGALPERRGNARPRGRGRILVLEDESLIALDLAEALERAGFCVVGPVRSTATALALIEAEGCDAAVLDVDLGTETSEAVALRLGELGVPFLTVSGFSRRQKPPALQRAEELAKPLDHAALVARLAEMLGQSGGEDLPPARS